MTTSGADPSAGRIEIPDALRRAVDLQRRGRYRDAGVIYDSILRVVPEQFDALHNLGLVRLQLGEAENAVALIQRALARNPRSVEAYNNLGGALQALNRQEESITPYRQALAINPRFADAHNNLGAAFKALGRIDEAINAFETAIALAPERPAFYRNFVDSVTIRDGDPVIAALLRLARDEAALARTSRMQLHFALAKVQADVGQKSRAFDHLLIGNRMKREDTIYDERNTLALFERIRANFTAVRIREGSREQGVSPSPVFVVGMPRSGTTLVEQIAATHPCVFGAGELDTLESLAFDLGDVRAPFPECLAAIDDERIQALGEAYTRRIERLAPRAARIVDKMPSNARFIGLIHLALPQARFIHVIRDPVDTCLSCFSILFMGNQPFTYDLGELGRYHKAHTRLMDHWRRVLPDGLMLEVHYEDVVANLEQEARRIIAHCGLDWDNACLQFDRTKRPVRTASAIQVRRPIYTTSVGRWRPDGPHLQKLLDALQDDVSSVHLDDVLPK